MNSTTMPPIVRAAQSSTLLDAALAYADLGMSLIPLTGKRPALTSWTQYQKQSASPEDIHRWGRAGLLHGKRPGQDAARTAAR